MGIRILGTGSYLPPKVVTNDDIAASLDTSDEWIYSHTGIHSRHVAGEGESTSTMAAAAAKAAMDAAGVKPEEIGLIVLATSTPDYNPFPSTACVVQGLLGCSNAGAFDLQAACAGFVYALEQARGFVNFYPDKKALVIGAESLTRILDWTDRSTCVIFGDGAGAMVITEGSSNLASRLFTQGGDSVLSIPAGKSNSPFYTAEVPEYRVVMNGQETFKFAVRRMAEDLQLLCEQAGITTDDLDYIVPHQANTRIIDLTARRLGIPMEKFVLNIDRYGNTSSASVPISFDELARSGKLKAGDKIAMCAFGGGLSSAGFIIEW